MNTDIDNSISSERMLAILSVFFAACAVLVTGIGLYGTLAYATARRTNEIGIRIALGASRVQVGRLVLYNNLIIAFIGAVTGLVGAFFATRLLSSFLYNTSVRDPWFLLTATILGWQPVVSRLFYPLYERLTSTRSLLSAPTNLAVLAIPLSA